MENLNHAYPKMSEAARKIADYMMQNPENIIHCTISQLGDLCGVSEATIVRFSKALGYDGFNEMKIYMASEMIPSNYWIQEDVEDTDTADVLVKKVMSSQMKALQNTMRNLNVASFERAVDSIASANRVELYASGNSKHMISDANYRFLCIGIPSYVPYDTANALMQSAMLNPQDVAIGVSISGSSKGTVLALENAKSVGATTICVTGYPKSPITKAADICLIAEAGDAMFREGSITSRIAHNSVLDALYIGVGMRRGDYSKEHIKESNKLMANEKY